MNYWCSINIITYLTAQNTFLSGKLAGKIILDNAAAVIRCSFNERCFKAKHRLWELVKMHSLAQAQRRGYILISDRVLFTSTPQKPGAISSLIHSQEKKAQKLSLGLYLFKRYTFVPKSCIL